MKPVNGDDWDGDCSEEDEDTLSVCANTDELDNVTINTDHAEYNEFISSGLER